MKKFYLTILCFALISSTAFAQYIPEYCGAPWPPSAGHDITTGKDNGGQPCIKMGSTTGWRIIHGKEGNSYYETIDADMIVISLTYIIFKKGGKEVGRFDRAYVRGWRIN